MLHSPGVDVIRAGEAIGALDTARAAGKIGQVGVSVDCQVFTRTPIGPTLDRLDAKHGAVSPPQRGRGTTSR